MSSDAHDATTRRRPPWLEDAERVDLALYAAVARTPTPALDLAMRRLASAADYSSLSMAAAGLLALAGGRTGRRRAPRDGTRLAGGHLDRGQRGGQAARTAPAPRPARRERCRSPATCRCRPRARSRPGTPPPRSRSPPASATCRRGPPPRCARWPRPSAIARPHRGALPRRRAGRRSDRDHPRAAHDIRCRPAPAGASGLTPIIGSPVGDAGICPSFCPRRAPASPERGEIAPDLILTGRCIDTSGQMWMDRMSSTRRRSESWRTSSGPKPGQRRDTRPAPVGGERRASATDEGPGRRSSCI